MAQHFETYTDLETALNLPALMPGAFRFAKQFAGATYTCSRCKQKKKHLSSGNGETGYAHLDAQFICYECCADVDREHMIATGSMTLYLTHEEINRAQPYAAGTVLNWPGTLRIPCRVKLGRHNIARHRYDAWFTGPDGKL